MYYATMMYYMIRPTIVVIGGGARENTNEANVGVVSDNVDYEPKTV